MIRIIDWNAVGAASLEFLICGVLGLVQLGDLQHGLSVILLPVAVIAFATLIQKLAGVTFDPSTGTLRFFSLWLRRSVNLLDIKDANCEFGIPLSPTRLILAFARSRGKRGRSEARQRTYMVNLSGPFGSRQVRFSHKRWRDRFLSVLRDQAPRCRITRWR